MAVSKTYHTELKLLESTLNNIADSLEGSRLFEDLEDAYSELETVLDDLKNRVEELEEANEDLEKDVEELEGRIEELESE